MMKNTEAALLGLYVVGVAIYAWNLSSSDDVVTKAATMASGMAVPTEGSLVAAASKAWTSWKAQGAVASGVVLTYIHAAWMVVSPLWKLLGPVLAGVNRFDMAIAKGLTYLAASLDSLEVATVVKKLVSYLTADFPHAAEQQSFWMAFQGSMLVRKGPNRDGSMNWFHSFLVGMMTSFSGAFFTFPLLGRPTSMFSNDLLIAMSIITYIITNHLPFDVGFKLGNTMPMRICTALCAQLLRAMSIVRFTQLGRESFSASKYYPTPVLGPIALATLSGNMGGFFLNGFHGHLKGGMPWNFQNGFFCATFYHLYVHDRDGFMGQALRSFINTHIPQDARFGLDDKVFGVVLVSGFMHIMCLLQFPELGGSAFSPFDWIPRALTHMRSKVPGYDHVRQTEGTKKESGRKKDMMKKMSSSPIRDANFPSSPERKRKVVKLDASALHGSSASRLASTSTWPRKGRFHRPSSSSSILDLFASKSKAS